MSFKSNTHLTFVVTLKPAVFAEYTTNKSFYSRNTVHPTTGNVTLTSSDHTKNDGNFTASDSGWINSNRNLLILKLIQIFGILDMILFCMYVFIFVHDRRSKKTIPLSESARRSMQRSSSMYQNIEIDLS